MGTQSDLSGVQALKGASTPLNFLAVVSPASLATLEFSRVLEVVAEYAAGPLGALRLTRRAPLADASMAAADLAPVGELLTLWARGETIDVPPVPVLQPVMTRLRVEGSVLSGAELALIKQTLAAVRVAAAELKRVAAEAPGAGALLVPLPERAIDQRLTEAVNDEGEVLDTASPALYRARREIHAARERLVKKLEGVLKHLEPQAVPNGAQVTIREGRYVIPVRRDSRQRPEGIVHDESASQGTLFVEPTATIEFGNALRSATAAAERELLKVLRELTELVRPQGSLIAAAHEMCVLADDLVARVRYAHAVGGVVPVVGGDDLRLRSARHPLLLARGLDVVPFDLDLAAHERTLLISGPNAGGKTVLLKTVGLAVLMAQAGIVPPVGAGTRLPVMATLFADIGDHQSIAADLSTFSAHVSALKDILTDADSRTLVLMDEVGSGTDPAEGGALAAATLRVLTARGARTVVTTHLGALKRLAGEVSGLVNGSLEFDAERLQPTFRFRKGVPGRSYGLAIARRLGIDPEVLALAERDVPDQERALDQLLAEVEGRAREVERRELDVAGREASVDGREASAAAIADAHSVREKELTRKEKEAVRSAREETRRHLLDARATVEAALKLAQGAAVDAGRATEARRIIEDAVAVERLALDQTGSTEREALGARVAPGQRVRLAAGGVGVVRQLRSDGKAVVTLGAVKVVVVAADLVPLAEPEPREQPRAAIREFAAPDAPFEIDLRGMRGDEAAHLTAAALDAAILADNPYLRIIHGMGTGVVRDRVRQVLKTDRRVARFEFAPQNQGGTGVTIAEFGGAG